jgi:hypothetical protein
MLNETPLVLTIPAISVQGADFVVGGIQVFGNVDTVAPVNVDLGNQFAPQIPPPPCNGDVHVIDQASLTPRSVLYTGNQATSPSRPLCDKHLVVLQNGQITTSVAGAAVFPLGSAPT